MKHLKALGLIVAVILFLLCLVGFELHTLGTLGRVEPDNPILQQAVVQSSIFALAKVFVLLYIIYVSILYCIAIYKKVQEDESTQDRIERILNKLTKLSEQSNVKPVEDIDFPLKQEYEKVNEVEFKKLVKPLIESYDNFTDYKIAIKNYYYKLSTKHSTIARDLAKYLLTLITTSEEFNIVYNILCERYKEINGEVIFNVLLAYCNTEVRDKLTKVGTEEA